MTNRDQDIDAAERDRPAASAEIEVATADDLEMIARWLRAHIVAECGKRAPRQMCEAA